MSIFLQRMILSRCCCYTPYWAYAKHYSGYSLTSPVVEVFRDDDVDHYYQHVNNGTNFAWSVSGIITVTPSKRSMRAIDPDNPTLIYDDISHEDYKTGELSTGAIPWVMLSDGSVIEAGVTHTRLVDNAGAAVWTVDHTSVRGGGNPTCVAVDESNGYVYIGYSTGVSAPFLAQCWDLSDGSVIWSATDWPIGSGIELLAPYGVVVEGSGAVWCGDTQNSITPTNNPDIWRTDSTGAVTDYGKHATGSEHGTALVRLASGYGLRMSSASAVVAVQGDLTTEDWRIETVGSDVLSVNAMIPTGDDIVFGGRWGASTSDVGIFRAGGGSKVWSRCLGRAGDGVTGQKHAAARLWAVPGGGYIATTLGQGLIQPKFWDTGSEPPW